MIRALTVAALAAIVNASHDPDRHTDCPAYVYTPSPSGNIGYNSTGKHWASCTAMTMHYFGISKVAWDDSITYPPFDISVASSKPTTKAITPERCPLSPQMGIFTSMCEAFTGLDRYIYASELLAPYEIGTSCQAMYDDARAEAEEEKKDAVAEKDQKEWEPMDDTYGTAEPWMYVDFAKCFPEVMNAMCHMLPSESIQKEAVATPFYNTTDPRYKAPAYVQSKMYMPSATALRTLLTSCTRLDAELPSGVTGKGDANAKSFIKQTGHPGWFPDKETYADLEEADRNKILNAQADGLISLMHNIIKPSKLATVVLAAAQQGVAKVEEDDCNDDGETVKKATYAVNKNNPHANVTEQKAAIQNWLDSGTKISVDAGWMLDALHGTPCSEDVMGRNQTFNEHGATLKACIGGELPGVNAPAGKDMMGEDKNPQCGIFFGYPLTIGETTYQTTSCSHAVINETTGAPVTGHTGWQSYYFTGGPGGQPAPKTMGRCTHAVALLTPIMDQVFTGMVVKAMVEAANGTMDAAAAQTAYLAQIANQTGAAYLDHKAKVDKLVADWESGCSGCIGYEPIVSGYDRKYQVMHTHEDGYQTWGFGKDSEGHLNKKPVWRNNLTLVNDSEWTKMTGGPDYPAKMRDVEVWFSDIGDYTTIAAGFNDYGATSTFLTRDTALSVMRDADLVDVSPISYEVYDDASSITMGGATKCAKCELDWCPTGVHMPAPFATAMCDEAEVAFGCKEERETKKDTVEVTTKEDDAQIERVAPFKCLFGVIGVICHAVSEKAVKGMTTVPDVADWCPDGCLEWGQSCAPKDAAADSKWTDEKITAACKATKDKIKEGVDAGKITKTDICPDLKVLERLIAMVIGIVVGLFVCCCCCCIGICYWKKCLCFAGGKGSVSPS